MTSWVPKVIVGDVRDVIRRLPNNFIDCVITSPPYWMQRDYGDPRQVGREGSPEEYAEVLAEVFRELHPKLRRTATVFLNIGYKYVGEELILIPEMVAERLRRCGYLLKNKVIWFKPNAMPTPARNRLNNVYEPVLVLIKREAREFYYFNLEEIAEKHKTLADYGRILSLKPEDYLGARVYDNLRSRGRVEGIVKGVRFKGSKITEVLIEWLDGGVREWVRMGDPLRRYPEEVPLKCPYCGGLMSYWDVTLSIANDGVIKCPNCLRILGGGVNEFPTPVLSDELVEGVNELVVDEVRVKKYLTKAPKSSKYLRVGEVFASSPAGRVAVSGEYLVIKRRWRVPQPLIAEYLRFWRVRRGVPIKRIDEILGYRDTAGHWFRRDFGEWGKGGSLPRPTDWLRLKEILGFNDIYDRVMTEVVAELQTVKPHEEGRNPGDVWSIKLEQFPGAHFAVFPKELVERCLRIGCPPGGVVLDPFAGSGTVGEVAKALGRKALLIELKGEYVELMRRRCGMVDVVTAEELRPEWLRKWLTVNTYAHSLLKNP